MRQNQVVAFASAITFFCSSAQSFETTLAGDTLVTVSTPVAGEIYSFSFTQDATGGHVVTWPSVVVNPEPIDPEPLTTSTQLFVCRSNGSLYPTTAGTYN